MLKTQFSILGKCNYKLTDNLTIHIPTLGEIRETETSENEYLYTVSIFTKTQCDYMVELSDIGKDYTQVDNYDIFLEIFCNTLKSNSVSKKTWDLLFENIDMSNLFTYQLVTDNQTVICDKDKNILINKEIYEKLSDLFRQIIFSTKNDEYLKVPEEETKKYLIERARKKRERNKLKNVASQLDGYILALVNNCNFKYDFKTVKNITLYDFYCSYQQIFKDKEVDGLLSGYWSGNVNRDDLTSTKLNRFIL